MSDNKETDMTAASITNISEFRAAVNGTEHLGDLVWWNVRLDDKRIDRALLKSVVESHGIATTFFPEEKTPAQALANAVNQTSCGTISVEIKPSLKSDDKICYVVRRNRPDGVGNLPAVQECMITLEKETGTISCDVRHEIGDIVVAKYHEIISQHVTEDVQSFLTSTVTKCLSGFALRDRGGFYFVPTTNRQKVSDLQEAVSKLGKSHLGVIGVGRTVGGMSGNLAEAADSAQEHLESELADLHKKLDALIEKPTSVEGKRINGLETKLAEFETLRSQAWLFRDTLGIEIKDLESKVDVACKRLDDEICKKGDEREAKRAAK